MYLELNVLLQGGKGNVKTKPEKEKSAETEEKYELVDVTPDGSESPLIPHIR